MAKKWKSKTGKTYRGTSTKVGVRVKRDAFTDVGRACKKFIRERAERGEMPEYGVEFQYGQEGVR